LLLPFLLLYVYLPRLLWRLLLHLLFLHPTVTKFT
jgi:hypothetical protein